MTYRILFLGDIVGEPGRKVVLEGLPSLQDTYQPLFTVVNGENSAGGNGITPKIADQLFAAKVDAITLGNHSFAKRESYGYLNENRPIVRPVNFPQGSPGRGWTIVTRDAIALAVINVSGRVSMEPWYDDPFGAVDKLDAEIPTPHRLLDFHAEATSEKITMGWHTAGRFSATVGTHTHVATADERVLPGGTAYITDVGMCGPRDSVLGTDRDIILRRFRTTLPEKFEVAREPGVICGVVIDVERDSGRATRIARVTFGE
jgi:2',3'-cyclic-nucleotide 2'-phosphodiesterase